MKKIKFTFMHANKSTRIVGIIALALALISILLLVVSSNTAVKGSITDLPIVKLFVPEDELDEIEDEYDKLIEEIEDAIDEDDDDVLDRIEDEFGMSAEKLLKKCKTPSLKTVLLLSEIEEDGEEAYAIFSIIITAINVYATILAIFVALSALFMNKGFFITSVSLSTVFFFTFVGAVWFFVFLALCIAYCILVSKVKTAYIVYKHTPVAPPAVQEPAQND